MPKQTTIADGRHGAFFALKNIEKHQAYTDIALDRILKQLPPENKDRGLISELVYGCVRQQRLLDTLIDQFASRPAQSQPPDLRLVLHLGLYQLRYLDHIPPSAAVNTTVDLAKKVGLGKLSKVVNGILRQYLRRSQEGEPLVLPDDAIAKIGVATSFPDWLVTLWADQWGVGETQQLCEWFNQTPHLDLRINPLKTERSAMVEQLVGAGIDARPMAYLPQGIRCHGKVGDVRALPKFKEGWFTVQDASAQLVSHLVDPQPGETIVDGCAAPGGKTTHLAELMGDRGQIIAIDPYPSRLHKVSQNAQRLNLQSITPQVGDSTALGTLEGQGDRVLIDAPCSGLGTLHKRPDLRWRHQPTKLQELQALQLKLLTAASRWVKPGGYLIYATCTLNPGENELVTAQFLNDHSQWRVAAPEEELFKPFLTPEGYLRVLPHRHQMDGFFMVRLQTAPNHYTD